MTIDTQYNFQAALGDQNRDADKHSTVLQNYHQFLWSKPLPNGDVFHLERLSTACLLRYESQNGSIILSSDRAVATFTKWKRLEHIVSQIPQSKLDDFVDTTETIGGIIIWPSTKVDGKSTINAERGFNRKISDRLDLTIECLRRYYNNESSPLFDALNRYDEFFRLFVNFQGYIDFFLFQDFVTSNYDAVKLAKPFDDFASSPVPSSTKEYIDYMNHTSDLVKARNARIEAYASSISNY